MKHIFLAIIAAFTFCSCAGTRVTKTNFASGALHPKKIFIKPFDAASFTGNHGTEAMKTIRESQAGLVFAEILKEQTEKIAPTTVLGHGESADGGWLITGSLEIVDAGHPCWRALFGHLGAGRSGILVHVRVIDADLGGNWSDKGGKGAAGNVLYDFEVAGGSRLQGRAGTIMASGLGYATPHDYRNAAERIYKTLEPDLERYGARSSASIR
jgi:hypothetical protein